MGAFVVVDLVELSQLFVEVFQRVRGGLSVQPFLQGLMEAFDFALGLRVSGVAVLLGDAQGCDEGFEGVASAASACESGGVDHAVVGQGGGG